MLQQRTLLTAINLNNAFLSKTNSADQSVSGNFQAAGGKLTLKNSILTDTTNSTYLQINPQGSKVIIYDGVTDQTFSTYSRSGAQYTQIKTVGGTDPYGQIDIGGVNRLEINTGSNLPIRLGMGGFEFFTGAGAMSKSRFFPLASIPDWSGWTLNAAYNNGWLLDDISKQGWFFKLDIRPSSPEFAVYKIPAGAGAHTDEYSVFKVTGTDQVLSKYQTLDDGIGGNANLKGTTTLNAVVVTGNATFSGNATFGAVTFTGSLTNTAGSFISTISNGHVELGSPTSANTPYIDFQSSGLNNDYDARILASSGGSGNALGTIQIMASNTTTTGTLAPYRFVLPVGTNMYA